MKILLTGANGQLGSEIQKTKIKNCELIALSHQQLDITNKTQVLQTIATLKPRWIINAAAYTAVDAAESHHELACAINAEGVANLAYAAKQQSAQLLHVSTDYVFAGTKNTPYLPTDETIPLNEYGKSKLMGERMLLNIMPSAVIIRTSWLYGNHGKNFVKTILSLLQQKEQLKIVSDQIGAPTSTKTLAQVIWQSIEKNNLSGIYHYSDAGVASWYDFAIAIQEEALHLGLINKTIPIYPIKTIDYPLPARRPYCSVLDKTTLYEALQITPLHWREALRGLLQELVNPKSLEFEPLGTIPVE
jgi:dTDP-4-dehydrorhamnose reductase